LSKAILTNGSAFVYVQIAGTLFIMLLGIAAALALLAGAFWLVGQFILLVFSALAACFSQIGETWQAADSPTRLLMLVCIALAGYWIARRKQHHA
jgi:hypothetical protein